MTSPAGRTGLFPIGPTAPRAYAAGSAERASTDAALAEVRSAAYDVPNIIGGREVGLKGSAGLRRLARTARFATFPVRRSRGR